jgi:hypothetical protein
MTVASDNAFPSILLVEGDPEALAANPAAGQRRLAVGEDHALYLVDDAGDATAVGGGFSGDAGDIPFTPAAGIAATDVQAAIVEDAGDLAAHLADTSDAHDASAISIADAGSLFTATDVEAALQEIGAAASPYFPPALSGDSKAYSGSGTSLGVTTPAYSIGATLIACVMSTGRGADSITQTNVTWTKRYAGNASSQYIEVWTGVVAGGAAGTTATFAFTGSNKQQCQVFELVGVSAITAAALIGSLASSAGTTRIDLAATGAAAGDLVLWIVSANSPSTSYQNLNVPFTATVTGLEGAGRVAVLRVPRGLTLQGWAQQSSSVATVTGYIKIS